MGLFNKLGAWLSRCVQLVCPPIHAAVVAAPHRRRRLKTALGFLAGFALGQIYYHYLLKRIPFPYGSGWWLAVVLSALLGEWYSVCASRET